MNMQLLGDAQPRPDRGGERRGGGRGFGGERREGGRSEGRTGEPRRFSGERRENVAHAVKKAPAVVVSVTHKPFASDVK